MNEIPREKQELEKKFVTDINFDIKQNRISSKSSLVTQNLAHRQPLQPFANIFFSIENSNSRFLLLKKNDQFLKFPPPKKK